MKWTVIIILGIAATAILYFLIRKNIKDEIDFEDLLNNNDHTPKQKANETDIESEIK